MKNNITHIGKIAVVFVFTTLAIPTIAQKPHRQDKHAIPNEVRVKDIVDELSKTLGLSEEQQKKIATIYSDHINSMQKHRKEAKEKAKKVKMELKEKMKTVLTEEQQKAFDTFLQSRRIKQRPTAPKRPEMPK